MQISFVCLRRFDTSGGSPVTALPRFFLTILRDTSRELRLVRKMRKLAIELTDFLDLAMEKIDERSVDGGGPGLHAYSAKELRIIGQPKPTRERHVQEGCSGSSH